MSQGKILMALVAFTFASMILVVSGDEESTGVGKRADWNTSISIEGDPELRDATARAHATLGAFIERLPELRAGGAGTSIKFPLTENDVIEHVWMSDVQFDGETFAGYLASEPVRLVGWSFGDRVTVAIDQVLDWAAVDDGTLYGGFSIYVLNARSSPQDVMAQDAHRGFSLPDRPIVWD